MPITDPSDIASCVAWWDPDSIGGLSHGDDISTWTDEIAGLVFTGPVGNKPKLAEASAEPSGHQTVSMYGNGDRFTIGATAALNNGNATYCILYAPNNCGVGNNRWVFNKAGANPANFALLQSSTASDRYRGSMRLAASPSTQRNADASAFDQRGIPQVVTVTYNGTTLIVRVNGVQVASGSFSGAIATASDAGLVLGNHPSTVTAPAARFGDVVICNAALTGSSLTDLEDWMMSKWLISTYNDAWTTGSVTDEMTPGAGEGELFSASIVTVSTTRYLFAALSDSAGNFEYIDYWTAPTSDPHNWTRHVGGAIIDSNVDAITACRAVAAVHDGSEWRLLVDLGDGDLYHFHGADLESLTNEGVVFSGAGVGAARHPCILGTQINGKWWVYFDARASGSQSGFGSIAVVETADWDTFSDARIVFDVSDLWWERTSVGMPSVKLRDGQFEMAYHGYNDAAQSGTPHYIGLAKSADGETWTRLPQQVPIYCPERGKSMESVDSPELDFDGTDLWLYFTSRASAGVDADIARVQMGSASLAFLAVGGGLGIPIAMYHRLRSMGV